MKLYKIIQLSLRSVFSLKTFWLYGSLYSFFTLVCLLLLAKNIKHPNQGIYDLIADISGIWGSTNQNMFIIVAIPLIVTGIHQLIEHQERSSYIVHSLSRFHLWHKHVISGVILSLILTCLIMGISFIVGGFLVGLRNTWLSPQGTISKALNDRGYFQAMTTHLNTYKIILTLVTTKFLGFLMITFSTLFLKRFIKKSAITMIILIALAGFDESGLIPLPIFTRSASLALLNWLTPSITIFHCFYLIIITLVLYAVTGWLYERKDFLS